MKNFLVLLMVVLDYKGKINYKKEEFIKIINKQFKEIYAIINKKNKKAD